MPTPLLSRNKLQSNPRKVVTSLKKPLKQLKSNEQQLACLPKKSKMMGKDNKKMVISLHKSASQRSLRMSRELSKTR